ncbi:MAG: prepilin peptidase [SAR92 clade bacterium]|uniref:Prepilin leader peptidase/N-methyltransferase n=1 Tax=SAR92 clade bacterium TaxID=2315479 RepID=A0A520MP75_9GAMM|nr:MAG: prepilin peptidase [SAR92 clade bacterium]
MNHFVTQNISPETITAVVFCFGLVVGSFLNVVILRLPQQLKAQWKNDSEVFLGIVQEDKNEVQPSNTLLWPPSHCTNCGQQIKPWQNIPVISYLLLRGRCNNCSHAISLQYPFVELLTGFMLAVTVAYIGDAINAIYAIIFTLCLIALAGIDVNEKLLPDQITLPLLWVGLFANINGTFAPLPDAVTGAIAGYLSLWSLYWMFKLVTGREGMGYGDFKLLSALGAWLGWQMLPLVILISSTFGAVFGVAAILLGGQGRNLQIPFGPFLAGAGWIALLWGDTIVTWYFSGFNAI